MFSHPRRHGLHTTLAGLCLALTALTASAMLGPTTGGAAPLPFDPPSQAEETAAAEMALANSTVRDSLGSHHVFLGAALRTDKIPGVAAADHPRLFDLWFYDYTLDKVVWPVVHPAEGQVVEIVTLDFPFQPPLAGVELQRGVKLAFDLDAARTRFPDGPPPVTAILVSGEGTACPANRCALLGFVEDRGPAMDFRVLVNLSEDHVMAIVEEGWQEVYAQ